MNKEELIRTFIALILHGSTEHRAWLIAAGEAYLSGLPIPEVQQ